MPCDSAGAGLIALGAMVHDLVDPQANDVDAHYDKLLQYARQFLESCHGCDVVCHPHLKRCGYARQATGRLRSPLLPHGTVTISDKTDFVARQIKWLQRDGHRNHCLVIPTPQHAINYHIEDQPAANWNQPNGELSPTLYQRLVEDAAFAPDTLRQSYSGLCFAGRASGERASREVCASMRFREGSAESGVDELLTIHSWSNGYLSRVSFFNPRTEQLDRNNASVNLVIADGDASFLKVVDHPEFSRSDIVGVVNRNIERDRLEAVGAKMQPNQWYAADTDKLCGLPSLPKGISVAIVNQRNL
jgi:hypothetical protein